VLVRRLFADRRAAIAVEFAMLAPVLIVFYFGAAELSEGYLANRRVAQAASEVGDLVAAMTSVTPSQVSDYFAAGDAIVAPFPTARLSQRVSSVTVDASGAATVLWSQASGAFSARAAGSSVSLPSGVAGANQSVVMSESNYVWTSNIGLFFKTPLTWDSIYYFEPRNSAQVTCATCS
jgi:Flp pilus assembly protein TadG